MTLRRVGLVVAIALALHASPPPAQAAQGTIQVGTFGGLSLAERYFTSQNCSAAAASSPLNGTDGAIVSLAGYPAGSIVTITWSGVVLPGGSLFAVVYGSNCSNLRPETLQATLTGSGGTLKLRLASGSRWVALSGNRAEQISYNVR